MDEAALDVAERVEGPDSATFADRLLAYGETLRVLGRYSEAEVVFRKSLAISEKLNEPGSRVIASDLNYVALAVLEQGRLGEAEELLRRALAIYELEADGDKDGLGKILNNLCLVLIKKKGSLDEAERMAKRALALFEEVLGDGHPRTLDALSNVAGIRAEKGEYAAAEPLFLSALERADRVLGAEHPYTRAALTRLATNCWRQGDYSRAEGLLRRSLEYDASPNTYCHLARVLLLLDRNHEAVHEVSKAWKNRAKGPPYITQRIYFFNVIFALLEGAPPSEALRSLRAELLRPDNLQGWDLKHLLDHLKPRFTPEANQLLEALSAAINDRATIKHLETLPSWKAII